MPIIEELASKESVIFSDGFKNYEWVSGLVDYSYKEHFHIKHSESFAVGNNHINGIENFWGLCKVRLTKFSGIRKNNFNLHIKECEFRYNNRKKLKMNYIYSR